MFALGCVELHVFFFLTATNVMMIAKTIIKATHMTTATIITEDALKFLGKPESI